MHVSKNDIPTLIDTFGAVARQKTDFGDATGCAEIGAEHFLLAEGTDITPLLKGLKDDLCQSPHWGYLVDGELTVRYADGSAENLKSGDLFYLPPGHTVSANKPTEFVLFSPQKEHTFVLEHMKKGHEESL